MKIKNMKYILIGILTSFVIFLLFGIPTALIPNNLFKRMIPATTIDYIFLSLTSVMLGIFVSLHFYKKQKINAKKDYVAGGGTVASILGFSCPTCNVLLISLFGVSAVSFYFEPLRPILGVIGTVVLGIALYLQIQKIKNS